MSKLSDLLTGVLVLAPDADAIEYQGKWHNWRELGDTVAAIRGVLDTLELGKGARVGVMVRNRPSAFAALLSAIAHDACIVSINPLLPEDRLAKDIAGLEVPVIVGEEVDLAQPAVLEAIARAGSAVVELLGTLEGARLRPGFEQITGAAIRRCHPNVIVEMLTSGTTGAPKRIALKRDAFEKSFISALSYEKGRTAEDPPRLRDGVVLLTNPLSHIGGLWGGLTCMVDGRKACLMEKFSVEGFRDAVSRHRPKFASAVPAGLRMILDANVPKEDLASLVAIRTGTAPLDPAIEDAFLDRYGIAVLQNYGATEFSGAVAGWTLKDFYTYRKDKVGSVGRFQPGVNGRVINPETGEEVAPGIEGVLEMQAKQFGIGDDWLKTTDRVVIDSDGFLFIRGRADNAIIRGGFKIHPDDVVAVLHQHPAVREAVVVGIKDRRLGAVPVAAIMLKNGADAPSEAELAAFAKQRLLPYQVPVRFAIVDDVPRTPAMKPALPQLCALFEETEVRSA